MEWKVLLEHFPNTSVGIGVHFVDLGVDMAQTE